MSSNNKKPSGPMSPLEYLKSGQARRLPIHACYVNENWQEDGLAQVIVSRIHKNGKVTAGFFLVDLLCVGAKDTHFIFNEPESEMQEMIKGFTEEYELNMQQCDYKVAHNIVYAGVDFAAEFGIEPCEDFDITKMVLEEDDDKVEMIDVECGEDGIPVLIDFGVGGRTAYYLKQLQKHAGEGNYKYMTKEEMGDDEEDEEEDPGFWEREDWEAFFDNAASVDLTHSRLLTGYLYTKGILLPEAAKQGVDLEALCAEFEVPVTGEPIVNKDYGNEEAENEEAKSIFYIISDIGNNRIELPDLPVRIKKAMKKWPKSPVFYNHLYNCYLLQNKHEEAEAVLKEQIALFPDYLFAKISYANRQIDLGNVEAIPGIFNGCTSLAQLYPSRTEFHISEFTGFIAAYCFYYIHKDDLFRTDCMATLLRDLPMESFTNAADKALSKFADYGIEKVNRLLTAVANNPGYRNEVIELLIND